MLETLLSSSVSSTETPFWASVPKYVAITAMNPSYQLIILFSMGYLIIDEQPVLTNIESYNMANQTINKQCLCHLQFTGSICWKFYLGYLDIRAWLIVSMGGQAQTG